MLHLQWVLEHIDEVKTALARRGAHATDGLEQIASLGEARRKAITLLEAHQAQRNAASAAMATLDKSSEAFVERRSELKALSDAISDLEAETKKIESTLNQVLMGVPNLPAAEIPDGIDSQANRQVRVWGEKRVMDFDVRDHVTIAEALGIVDFDRAAKLCGARFAVLVGMGARLERALISFMLDLHIQQQGYQEVWVPALVRGSALRGTGQLPKFADDLFRVLHEPADDFYLIPTAEVPVTNLHAGEILELAQMPLAYTAYTPCFRSEAGSYGKDTRGLIRQHQFDKVELVRFVEPDKAEAELESLTQHAEKVLQALGLHYRVMELCAGDLGFSAKKTYDIEVWLPGQSAYREISSCSWFGDFQSRRANIRYRSISKKPEYVHTLNGSALAVGRTLVAILEQYQQADGSVIVPEVLRPYVGGAVSLSPKA